MLNLLLKRRSALLGLMIGSTLLISACKMPLARPKAPVALREWHGTKEEVIDFLKGPNAQSSRWQVEAIGN